MEGTLNQLKEVLVQQQDELTSFPENQEDVRPQFEQTSEEVEEANDGITEIWQNPAGINNVQQRFQQIQQLQDSIKELMDDIECRLLPQNYPDPSR